MKNNEIVEKIISGEMSVDDVVKEMDSLNLGNPDSFKLDVKFKNESDNEDPKYAKSGDSGFDLRANLTEPITLGSLERALVPTGLYFELPNGVEGEVRPRSGMSIKFGITVLNTPGTVDSNYRGEIKVILVNLSKDEFTINHGDRVAQMVLNPVLVDSSVNLKKTTEIEINTERGSTGFGSTGIN